MMQLVLLLQCRQNATTGTGVTWPQACRWLVSLANRFTSKSDDPSQVDVRPARRRGRRSRAHGLVAARFDSNTAAPSLPLADGSRANATSSVLDPRTKWAGSAGPLA
jgi:hypothetical protein